MDPRAWARNRIRSCLQQHSDHIKSPWTWTKHKQLCQADHPKYQTRMLSTEVRLGRKKRQRNGWLSIPSQRERKSFEDFPPHWLQHSNCNHSRLIWGRMRGRTQVLRNWRRKQFIRSIHQVSEFGSDPTPIPTKSSISSIPTKPQLRSSAFPSNQHQHSSFYSTCLNSTSNHYSKVSRNCSSKTSNHQHSKLSNS